MKKKWYFNDNFFPLWSSISGTIGVFEAFIYGYDDDDDDDDDDNDDDDDDDHEHATPPRTSSVSQPTKF